MPQITLPDGTLRDYDEPVSPARIAADIGPGLAKAALGARINGVLTDLSTPIESDVELALITAKTREGTVDDEALFLLRHSCAHVMAEAIEELFPGTQLVYGPPVDNGFYYDIAFPDGSAVSSEDFARIEEVMKRIIKEDRTFTRYELPCSEGLEKLRAEGSKYKIDNAERAIEAGSDALSWYATGEPGTHWEDLCRGPHVPSTGKIGAFKLMSLASSYWHGDENSDRLTRVYGTAFADKKQLKQHLARLEEAQKRDHRILGRQLQLFTIDEQVGQGLILWKPAGAAVRQELQNFISEELTRQGYAQVFTPHIGKLDLYRTSGHYPYYQESQYTPIIDRETLGGLAAEGCSCSDLANRMDEGEIDGYLLKPMNCPHHIKIYASEQRSYRDLPVRLAEFGTVYRWEQSGEIGGMTRVRGFTQDDAHLFCREDQIAEEVQGCLHIVKLIFSTLGMSDYRVRVGLRDPDGAKYVGDPANWDRAEDACRTAAATLGVPFTEEPGEAAFYGPKIDFVVKDVIGREWQLGTIQVDYNLPERFGLEYIGADNQRHRPVMIHRAPFGSMERFIGVLIEHFAGAFPCWLAPEQVRVLPISEKSNEYAEELLAALLDRGLRATIDDGSDRIQGKVKVAADLKIPYLAVVGPRDAESRSVSVRAFGIDRNLGAVGFDEFVDDIARESNGRGETSLLTRFEETAS
ncbi:MAG: threonine--tRNA ligase [Planctomycetes bacterium TMED75]|nr:threonine--tRNA ligase [Planctomycetaceae bacterium]OUU92472.1 MAG: threonine--tRNA ligase [Planctomycetes bacterium TMED75]